jgi:hypothetical protein
MPKGLNLDLYSLLDSASDPRVYVSALILRPKYEVLLVKGSEAPYKGIWHLPGGKLRPGWSFRDSLAYHLGAQLGVSAKIHDITPYVSHDALPAKDGTTHDVVQIILRAEIDPFGKGPACGIGIQEWRFVNEVGFARLMAGKRTRFDMSAFTAYDDLIDRLKGE